MKTDKKVIKTISALAEPVRLDMPITDFGGGYQRIGFQMRKELLSD